MITSVYVGSGEHSREGYVNCDVRPLPGVELVCNAWELSLYVSDLERIYSRHMLEHLTDCEARATLEDWHRALRVDGEVEIVVPNLDFHIAQWLKANWDESANKAQRDERNWAFAGFYGWQHCCDPACDDYDNSYWDVHKSGYNEKRLSSLLRVAGFRNLLLPNELKPHHLHMKATK